MKTYNILNIIWLSLLMITVVNNQEECPTKPVKVNNEVQVIVTDINFISPYDQDGDGIPDDLGLAVFDENMRDAVRKIFLEGLDGDNPNAFFKTEKR